MSNEIVRHSAFGDLERQAQSETAMATVVAREQAMVQARFIMALKQPRNWDDIRVRLLSHCDRPGFAEVARYKKPAGRAQVNGEWVDTFAEGFSARFAEVARQELGNLDVATQVTFDNAEIRMVRAVVLDLQRNNSDGRDITVTKVVEKKGKFNKQTKQWEPPAGREILSERVNTAGDPVWLCRATEDEIRMRQNSEISKAHRDETLRLIPRDILDECEAKVFATKNDPKKVDPTAARKKVIDAFATLNLLPSDLVNYLGITLDKASPKQIEELRGLYTAIKDGEITFEEAMRLKYEPEGGDAPRTGEPQKTTEQVATDKIAGLKGEQQPTTTAPKQEQPQPTTTQQQPTTTQQPAGEQQGLLTPDQQTTTTRGNAATSDPGPKRGFQTFGGGKKP